MALYVEQERKPVNIVGILMGVVIVAALVFALYFFFFERPELIDVIVPDKLEKIKNISKTQIQPEAILRSEKFQALKRYEVQFKEPVTGKSNPFLP